jgi:hypothetical protein
VGRLWLRAGAPEPLPSRKRTEEKSKQMKFQRKFLRSLKNLSQNLSAVRPYCHLGNTYWRLSVSFNQETLLRGEFENPVEETGTRHMVVEAVSSRSRRRRPRGRRAGKRKVRRAEKVKEFAVEKIAREIAARTSAVEPKPDRRTGEVVPESSPRDVEEYVRRNLALSSSASPGVRCELCDSPKRPNGTCSRTACPQSKPPGRGGGRGSHGRRPRRGVRLV